MKSSGALSETVKRKFLLLCTMFLFTIVVTPAQAIQFNFGGFSWEGIGTVGPEAGGAINFQRDDIDNSLGGGTGKATIGSQFDLSGNPSFSAFFEFDITNNQGGGADGLVFVLHDDPVGMFGAGSGGGFLGYYERHDVYANTLGTINSVAVEFDIYYNGNYNSNVLNDPNNNHIGIATNGQPSSLVNQSNLGGIDLNSSARRFAWIDYDGVTLDVSLATSATKPGTALLSQTIDIASIVGSSGWIGFTSSTGNPTSDHRLHDFSLTGMEPVPEPTTILLLGTGLIGLAGFRRKKFKK